MKNVGKEHDGTYGSGRFCSCKCAKSYSSISNNVIRKQEYFVYRVAWNEINSEEGKQMMKDKIELFLDFYEFYNL